MRKLLFLIAIFFLLLSSWTIERPLNRNTWYVKLGHKDLLTWEENKIGDTVNLDLNKLNKADTLLVQEYLCGHNPENNSTTILTLKNQEGKTISKTINEKTELLFYTGKIQLATVLDKMKIINCEFVNIYFAINHRPDELGKEVLIGTLKLD